jgi:hypothetical protein
MLRASRTIWARTWRSASESPSRHGAGRRRRELQRRLHHDPQLVQRDRLGQVVEGARLQRRNRIVGAAERGNDRDGRVAVSRSDFAHEFDAQAVGQAHVGQHHRIRMSGQQRARLGQVGGAIAVQPHLEESDVQKLAQICFIVDD